MRIRPVLLLCLLAVHVRAENPVPEGAVSNTLVPTHQLIHPAGQTTEFGGRPVDLTYSPDGATLYVLDNRGVVVLDAATGTLRQELKFPTDGGSLHGLALTKDGRRLYAGGSRNTLWEATLGENGQLKWSRSTVLPLAPDLAKEKNRRRGSLPCGIALSADEKTAFVCLSVNNTLAVVDLDGGKLLAEIPVGVAPYAIALSPDGSTAYVSNWGGRRPKQGERTADSAGTATLIDNRGVASSGTVGIVDLKARKQVAEIAVGLHPAGLAMTRDGATLYVANANSDTVSVIDTAGRKVRETIPVRPDPALLFGSASNALALSADEKTLYVANGGNNAVAVVNVAEKSSVAGFIPAGWYPGAVAIHGKQIAIANIKGVGSRDAARVKQGWNSRLHFGTVSRVEIPDAATLAKYTQQVRTDARVPEALAAAEKAETGVAPVAIPKRVGEPSTLEHVIYILKENRTYDQVFGDMKAGNGDPKLVLFGRDVTPNHHALAEQFVLLDNYYCNGVLSADGHQWAMEGIAVDGLEKSFGGWTRSYPYPGDDPLAFPPSGFIWDNVLLHGRSFRNFGEMGLAKPIPASATFEEMLKDHQAGTGKITYEQNIANETLRGYSHLAYPGWNMAIPDQVRMDIFLKQFKQYEKEGTLPNLMIVYLPNDHTRGASAGAPTPAAMVADNDLAVGRLVEAVSHSRFWPKTAIFAIEDDPQDGFDHVDGHRSTCLVVSPYTKRNAVVSHFYNQTSVLHTIELILGLPPMNQMDAMAPVMRECFTDKADLTPYKALKNKIPLDQMNPGKAKPGPAEARDWAAESLALRFDVPDMANEDTLNRILWHTVKGDDAPYPADLAGAHGKGLAKLGLKLDAAAKDDDDDDDDDDKKK